MFDDLVTRNAPTEKRKRGLSGDVEEYFSEGAVMLAYAMHLIRQHDDAKKVLIHPDGEHGKRFQFVAWLALRGFVRVSETGTTGYGGLYRRADGREIVVNPKPGLGDVRAVIGNTEIVAEAKGGVINTRHAGQTSRLRRGLCEAIGLLLATELKEGTRQVAVVPKTPITELLAKRMIDRVRLAGIEIALVDGQGNVTDVN